MMRIVPTNWRIQVKIFENYGCKFQRQKGDHLIYHHPKARRAVVIPKYKEIPVTIIRINMKNTGMTRDEYFEILENL